MIDHIQHPPADRPSLADGVGDPVGPESAGNRHRRQIRVPGVSRIFRHDAAMIVWIVGRRFRGVDRLFLQDPPDGRLADMDTCPGQLVGDLRLAQRRAEQLDLLNSIADEIRKSIHRRSGLNEQVVVGTPQPRSDGVVGQEETAGRFRFAPASHGPQLQDGHPLDGCVLGTSVRDDTLHPCTVDA